MAEHKTEDVSEDGVGEDNFEIPDIPEWPMEDEEDDDGGVQERRKSCRKHKRISKPRAPKRAKSTEPETPNLCKEQLFEQLQRKVQLYGKFLGVQAPRSDLATSSAHEIADEIQYIDKFMSNHLVSELAFNGILNTVSCIENIHDKTLSPFTKIKLEGWKHNVETNKDNVRPIIDEMILASELPGGMGPCSKLALVISMSAIQAVVHNNNNSE